MIHTDRLLIRRFYSSDYQDLYEYLSLQSTYTYEPGEPICLEQAKLLASKRVQANNFFAVILKKENKMIGHLYFEKIEPSKLMTWELGYIFNPKYHKQGFAQEAARALIEYAFKNLQAHRVVAHCNPKNTASWRLLQRIGMRKEGCLKKNNFFRKDQNGQPLWTDSYVYAMLKSDLASKI